MPNLYIDEQGRPMDYRRAVEGLRSGELTPEQEIGQALEDMNRAKDELEKARDATTIANVRQNLTRRVTGQPATEAMGRAPLREPKRYTDTERRAIEEYRPRFGEQPLESDPRIGTTGPTLREEYDAQMARRYAEVAKMRRETPERDSSGYPMPRTPLPAEKGTATYESKFRRYKTNYDKALKKKLEGLENRRLILRKAESDLRESEAKVKKYEGEAKEAEGKGKYFGEGGKAVAPKSPSAKQQAKIEKRVMANFMGRNNITQYADKTFESEPMDEKKKKDLESQGRAAGLNVYFTKPDKDGNVKVHSIMPSGEGQVTKTAPEAEPEILYSWVDENGVTQTSRNEADIPARFRTSARVYRSGSKGLAGEALGKKKVQRKKGFNREDPLGIR